MPESSNGSDRRVDRRYNNWMVLVNGWQFRSRVHALVGVVQLQQPVDSSIVFSVLIIIQDFPPILPFRRQEEEKGSRWRNELPRGRSSFRGPKINSFPSRGGFVCSFSSSKVIQFLFSIRKRSRRSQSQESRKVFKPIDFLVITFNQYLGKLKIQENSL